MTGVPAERVSTRHWVVCDTLIVDLGARMRVLSSAPRGGGLRTTRYILNHQVPSHPPGADSGGDWTHPSHYLRRLAETHGVDSDCVGLMTAVPMTQFVTHREEQDGLWVEGFATVGVTNAVRAGEPVHRVPGERSSASAGTINLILVTNGCLAVPAMVGAVQVATESKTGLLRDHAVPSWTGLAGATGTGTDAVVVASALRGNGPWHPYAGTHTEIGSMIGRVVAECLLQGLALAARWAERHRP
ncbi:MAG TPA: adenosylcobinamide amidohydrolase [Nitrospira sp.]|nr:adenosylcobinamide amidohydrolase [Nitrospira sp.]